MVHGWVSFRQSAAWHIVDPYVRFWGRYILPYTGAIEQGQGSGLVEQVVRPTWDQFVATVWENLARSAVYDLAAQRTPGFWPEAIGSWWDTKHQIDLVAVSYGQKIAWLGEARWRNQPMDMEDLFALQRKIRAWQAEETGWRIYQVLFSRSGFTQPVRQRADSDPDLLLFGPEDMI